MRWANCWSILLIFYEVTDKVFDGLTTVEYYKKKLFRNPKQSVHDTLLVFMIIGCVVSTGSICFSIWEICCYNEEKKDLYKHCSNCVRAIKVIIEAFPQSLIAKFGFDGCPIKTSPWNFLDTGFDIFCIIPFVLFMCCLFWWCCCGNGIRVIFNRHGTKKEKAMSCFIGVAYVMSIAGFVLAIMSFVQSTSCP